MGGGVRDVIVKAGNCELSGLGYKKKWNIRSSVEAISAGVHRILPAGPKAIPECRRCRHDTGDAYSGYDWQT